MFIHNVFFWLKPGTTAEESETFLNNVRALKSIDLIDSVYVGTPAMVDRPVVDNSYSVCLTTIFKDRAAHDAYQVHPDHKAFIAANNHLWQKVQIYDAVE